MLNLHNHHQEIPNLLKDHQELTTETVRQILMILKEFTDEQKRDITFNP